MIGHREMSIDDYLEIFRRRRWILLIPALLVPLIVFSYSLFIPDEFMSKTLVLVEEQKVPDSIVQPVVTEDITQRLATMQEQILSRTRLQPIIEKFALYQGGATALHMEDKVEILRGAISITPVRTMPGSRTVSVPGFYISFTTGNAQLAQRVCAEITSMFIEENLRAREQRSQGTTEFLATQLGESKRKLDETDAKLAEFKSRYLGSLPGQEQTSISIMTGLSSQLESVTQGLSRAQQDKAYSESMLSQQLANMEASALQGPGDMQPDMLQLQLVTLQKNLLEAQSRYTDDHPDVIKLKNDVAEVQKKIELARNQPAPAPATSNSPSAARETPQTQQLRAQIRQLDQTIQGRLQDQRRIQGQIGMYQSRLSLSPAVEQQFKELMRDYQTALTFYNDLLAKESQSKMATSLERRQQGEQFRVMDPANLPQTPSYPNRPLFAAGGLGVGLAIGIGITLLLEMKDRTIRTEGDVKFFLQVPTLALIPISQENLNGRKRQWPWMRRKSPRPEARAEA